MKVIVAALLATIGAACVHAQPAQKLPEDFTKVAFKAGEKFGMAEALVQSCELAVVDPKIRWGVMSGFPKNYMDVFEKGFNYGWREALAAANRITIEATVEQKRCVLGLELFGPQGTLMKNLIIPLGGDEKR